MNTLDLSKDLNIQRPSDPVNFYEVIFKESYDHWNDLLTDGIEWIDKPLNQWDSDDINSLYMGLYHGIETQAPYDLIITPELRVDIDDIITANTDLSEWDFIGTGDPMNHLLFIATHYTDKEIAKEIADQVALHLNIYWG